MTSQPSTGSRCNWLVNVSETTIGGIVALVAKRAAFDPLCDSLKSLAWDGAPRVDSWLAQYLGAQDSPYVAFGRTLVVDFGRRARVQAGLPECTTR